MCKIEDDLITCHNQAELKLLYEKMGDGACTLRNFPKAIEYYKKMLEAAERSGASDKELGECYFSLGKYISITVKQFRTPNNQERPTKIIGTLTKQSATLKKSTICAKTI